MQYMSLWAMPCNTYHFGLQRFHKENHSLWLSMQCIPSWAMPSNTYHFELCHEIHFTLGPAMQYILIWAIQSIHIILGYTMQYISLWAMPFTTYHFWLCHAIHTTLGYAMQYMSLYISLWAMPCNTYQFGLCHPINITLGYDMLSLWAMQYISLWAMPCNTYHFGLQRYHKEYHSLCWSIKLFLSACKPGCLHRHWCRALCRTFVSC